MATKQNLVEIYSGKLENIDCINSIGFHVTRLKAISATRAFIAIDKNLYDIDIEYPLNPKIEKGRQGPFISRPIQLKNVKIRNNSKPILSMKYAIQDINIIEKNEYDFIISCIDNHGNIYVKHLNQEQENKEIASEPPKKRRKLNFDDIEHVDNDKLMTNYNYSISMKYDNGLNYLFNNNNNNNNCKNDRLCQSGYCSLDRDRNNFDNFISISSCYKLLNIGNRDKIICDSIYLSQEPFTCKYYKIPQSGNNSSVILINSGNILSIWDQRDIKKCISRIDLRNDIYSIDINISSSTKYIGCCGLDKIIYIIDPFKWNIHSMWKSCSKYQLLQCKFSKFNKSNGKYIYCVGMDHDLICGQWETTNFIHNKKLKKKNKNIQYNKHKNHNKPSQTKQNRDTTTNDLRFSHCFRSDSKWVGVDYVKYNDFESMIGITNTATIYVAHKPHLLNPATHL